MYSPLHFSRRIYIPLCFYLYKIQAYCPIGQINLHSTMFLLIQIRLFPTAVIWHLHSTMFLLIPIAMNVISNTTGIYIPLCFYLYDSTICTDPANDQIYIPLCFYLYDNTFEAKRRKVADLHSTMFLLIQKPPVAIYGGDTNLHSTMFLLIRQCRCKKS